MKTPIEFLNSLHVKYWNAFQENKISKEKWNEFENFYSWVLSLYSYKNKKN